MSELENLNPYDAMRDAADEELAARERGASQRQRIPNLVWASEVVDDALRELDRVHDGDRSCYVPTGIEALDRNMGGGMRRGEFVLLGAPTGSGKTSLVVQFAMEAQRKGPVIVVSPEMTPRDLIEREIVRRARLPKWDRAPWKSEEMRADAKRMHEKAAEELRREKPRVAIYDSTDVTIREVVDLVREAHARKPLSLVALDYAQQLADPLSDRARHLAVGEVAHTAIGLARECDCAVLVTSQVNARREGKSIEYSFRESQVLEHKAPCVLMFLVERDGDGRVTRATFQTRKTRGFGWFSLEVHYDAATFRVSELSPVEAPPPRVRDWDRQEEWIR